MGAYINPPTESKEDFLLREGTQIDLNAAKGHLDYADIMLVILVHNGPFTAAAIAFNQAEKEDFLEEDDSRPKLYFLVEKSKLLEVSNELKYYSK